MTDAPANSALDLVVEALREWLALPNIQPTDWKALNAGDARLILAALAQTNDAGRGEPIHVATLHDDGHWVLNANHPDHTKHRHESDYAGWKLKVYLAPPSGAVEPKIYTKADAEALCAIAVAASTSGTYESNCGRIEKRLMEHRLSYTHGDDGDAYPLVDRLTPYGEKSIETGRKEIELLAENIADLFGKPEPPSGAAVRDMSAVEKALDEYVNMRGPYLTPMYSQDQAAAARAALMSAIRALSTQPRGGDE